MMQLEYVKHEYPTTLVNVKVKYIRPQYQNLKEWCEDENNVYIGRGGIVFIDGARYPPQSKWHNPFKSKDYPHQDVVTLYEEYIRQSPLMNDLHELKGKTLGCWCVEPNKPEIRCHGHVLLGLLTHVE